jgi:4-hydroxy-L-threonine phosphate dehydrogenase PdxA
MKRRIAIAIGDPNGIGPEIAVKAAARQVESGAQAVLVGDGYIIRDCMRRYAAGMQLCTLDEADDADTRIIHVPVAALDSALYQPGKVDAAAGRATIAYVTEAVRLAEAGQVDAVIGCPHSETAVNAAGIAFSGYPGLIAQLSGKREDEVFLMLVAAGLRIAHVTLHESVRRALGRLTPELVTQAGIAALDAVRRLGIAKPKLGVFGINPHAGEDGLFGDDDESITKPAVARLRALGFDVDGPVGADLLLAQRRHDVYLAIFHDQGHIPIKLLSPLRASALSIGGSVLFSSVGHGSAFDIAGRGIADPASVIETMALLHAAAPLPKHSKDRT